VLEHVGFGAFFSTFSTTADLTNHCVIHGVVDSGTPPTPFIFYSVK